MSRADKISSFTNESFSSINPSDTYNSFFGANSNYNDICHKETCRMFQDKFKAIFETGRNNGLQEGETVVLVTVYSKGKFLEDIPYCELDDVKIFVQNNSNHFLSFVNPELHAFLLRTNYFRKNKYSQFSKKRTARIANILDQLSKQRAKKEKYDKLADIISKLK